MKILRILPCLLLLTSCHHHFISDNDYRAKVEKQFEQRKVEAGNRSAQLFKVFDLDLKQTEREALEFLYAYMPLSDLADYDGDFYLKNVRASLSARDTFSWGKQVPEKVFRHFVLPVRVNNENLDSSRWLFFMELKDRIRKMTMKQAVLEVNHWCHEKVNYRGTDGRTSAPLATVKTAYGRCGEESTFTVAALRAVGIPARQCYTPRWAHGDDNHAWVEVWVDGRWHYIGACEPEADLDMAWFTAPAKRAMLVNTNVFGDYEGPEDVLVKDPLFTRINILSNYAPVKRIFVRVINKVKRPVDSAAVEFQLYNYAEFYPLHRAFTNKSGLASFQTGFGDLIIWAAHGASFGYRKITVKDIDTVDISLNLTSGKVYPVAFDLVPPPEQNIIAPQNDSLKRENSKKLAFEDKIRANYESTFIDSVKSFRLAATLRVNADSLWLYARQSRGNWREIIDFISGAPAPMKTWIFPLLSAVSEKDLHDVTPEVLEDNLIPSLHYNAEACSKDIFIAYILSPRIDNEWLRSYKQYFLSKFPASFIDSARKDPGRVAEWIRTHIRIDKASNYGRAPLTPIGSYELKISDPHSRDIQFVALCRSFGIPARLEPGTRIPQYYIRKNWNDVVFEKTQEFTGKKGSLTLTSDPANDRNPEYYSHFTIEKFTDGFFRSLDYETEPGLNKFPCSLELTPGYYCLVTGNRIGGGTVLASVKFFNLEAGKESKQQITLRKNPAPQTSLGIVPMKKFLSELTRDAALQPNLTKGTLVIWMEPDKEPTKHVTADLKLKSGDLTRWNGNMIMLFPSEKEKSVYIKANGHELPAGMMYLTATPQSTAILSKSLDRSLGSRLPLVVYLDTKGTILYLSEGYRIGIGDDVLRLINR